MKNSHPTSNMGIAGRTIRSSRNRVSHVCGRRQAVAVDINATRLPQSPFKEIYIYI
jgi:hypothetical protein